MESHVTEILCGESCYWGITWRVMSPRYYVESHLIEILCGESCHRDISWSHVTEILCGESTDFARAFLTAHSSAVGKTFLILFTASGSTSAAASCNATTHENLQTLVISAIELESSSTHGALFLYWLLPELTVQRPINKYCHEILTWAVMIGSSSDWRNQSLRGKILKWKWKNAQYISLLQK